MKFWTIIVLAFLSLSTTVSAQNSDMGSVRQQKEKKQQEIKRTSSQIDDTKQKINRQLNALRSVEADISQQEKVIKSLGSQLDSIDSQVAVVNDSIATINKTLSNLRESYAQAVKKIHSHSSSFDRLMFIFSANSFHEAYRRMRYMKQFGKWRERNATAIGEQVQLLENEKSRLENLKSQKTQNLTAQQRAKLDLEGQKKEQNKVIAQLRKQDKQLKATLNEQKRQADALDKELDRLIAEEQRRIAEEERQKRVEEERKKREAEERAAAEAAKRQQEAEEEKAKQQEAGQEVKPTKGPNKTEVKDEEPKPVRKEETREPSDLRGTAPAVPKAERTFKGTFESNKGQLLFPVTGKYKIVSTFGQHQHPDLKYVKVNNNGIDIEVAQGAVARAVFDGKVSAVFPQDGFHTVVMVRHGKYLTIYVNLSEIYVRKGEELKANQPIGKVYADPNDNNRAILHFEVRKEKEKLDPLKWVK